jgi:hypothetical protein
MESDRVLVVMLGYKSLSGKDTVYQFAKDLGFVRAAFADKLKDTVADLYNLTDAQVHGSLKDVMDERYLNKRDPEYIVSNTHYGTITSLPNSDYTQMFTPRRILQLFGQDQRSIYEDIWAAYVFGRTIPELVKQGHNKVMITDFRFRNEARVAKLWEAADPRHLLEVVNISRPGIEAKSGAGDISENDLNEFEGWTASLLNDDSLESLKDKSLALLTDILKRAEIS